MQQNTGAKFCIFNQPLQQQLPIGVSISIFDFIQAKRDVTPAVMTQPLDCSDPSLVRKHIFSVDILGGL